jgi:hypothetical protein
MPECSALRPKEKEINLLPWDDFTEQQTCMGRKFRARKSADLRQCPNNEISCGLVGHMARDEKT